MKANQAKLLDVTLVSILDERWSGGDSASTSHPHIQICLKQKTGIHRKQADAILKPGKFVVQGNGAGWEATTNSDNIIVEADVRFQSYMEVFNKLTLSVGGTTEIATNVGFTQNVVQKQQIIL